MNIKVVLADIDNTLLDFNKCARAALKSALEQNGFCYSEEMYPIFERENNGIWKELEQGLLTREELHAQRFCRILRALGLDESKGRDTEEAFQREVGEGAEHVTGALALLEYLGARYSIYAASNARQARQVKRLEKAGFMPYLKGVFSSEDMGANKPAAAFFDGVMARLPGIVPADCVIIGDSLSADILGGKNYGIHTIWYNHDQLPVPEDCPAEHVVSSLADICHIL